ncbi:MAG TPA: gamma-glutamylcyclotransferase, partial [Euzebya sp.]|nr:gamma-glutamylcyclotransferase [Euzebya sp.]
PRAALEAAWDTARTVAAEQIHQAERRWHAPTGMPGTIGVMPCHLPDDGRDPAIFTTKLVGVFSAARPAVNGLIAVQNATTGKPLATIDAAAVTAARTAAASGLSVDLLARSDAATVAIIGAGVQGWAHLQSVQAVRAVTAVRIWNRSPRRAQAFASRARSLPGITSVEVCATPAAATLQADVVCVCTDSATPLVHAADIRAGTHVTAVGAFRPDTRELAADLIARADHLVVDDRAAAEHEAGDILLAIADGVIGHHAVTADLAQLVSGAVRINRQPGDVTVYKSVGTSAMDAVAVRHLLRADASGRLAAYGTLAPGEANARVLAGSGGTWRTGVVQGHRVEDGWEGYPGLQIGEGPEAGPVEVAVLDAEVLDWTAIEAFEGPGYRRRRTVVALHDGSAVLANVFVLAR